MVYSNGNEGYSASICSRTTEVSQASHDLSVLGSGEVPSGEDHDNQAQEGNIQCLVILGLIILVGVSVVIIIIKNRNKL